MRDQEVESAVDGGRGGPATLMPQPFEHGISADRRMAAPDQLEHAAAERRQPRPAPGAEPLGRGQRRRDAVAVVVVCGLKRRWARPGAVLRQCYTITSCFDTVSLPRFE